MVTLREIVVDSFPKRKKFRDEIFSRGDVINGKQNAKKNADWHRDNGWYARVVPSEKFRGWHAVYLKPMRSTRRL